MTQPVDDFTTEDLGRGYWKADDPRRIRDRELAELVGEFTGQKLPRRKPGEHALDPVFDLKPPPITAPHAGTYVLNHQPGHIELWQVDDDGNPIELTDAALWE